MAENDGKHIFLFTVTCAKSAFLGGRADDPAVVATTDRNVSALRF